MNGPCQREEKVQTVGDQLFAGSAFTDDQHRFIERRQPRDLFQHFEKAVGFAE
jgi:capsule polysaccharide export protein KpsC/LpsZ